MQKSSALPPRGYSNIASPSLKWKDSSPRFSPILTKSVGDGAHVNLADFYTAAKALLPQATLDYYQSGSENERCLAANINTLQSYNIVPRMLRDVSKVRTAINCIGLQWEYPFAVAPMAFQRMAHPDGEVAMARAAAMCGVPMCLSTLANTSLDEAAATGHQGLMFQLYALKDRELTRSLVQDAERLGYKALVLTVDAPVLGRREADIRNRFRVPSYHSVPQLQRLSAVRSGRAGPQVQSDSTSSLLQTFNELIDDSLTWDTVTWLKSITSVPILLKGILHPKDALLAAKYGANGIVVSNHGGRQLDAAPGTAHALYSIARVLAGNEERPVLLADGGIRRGSDVIKMLGLGADAVLLGRPLLYALAVGGEQGVVEALRLFATELELSMQLSGCPTVADVTPEIISVMGPTGLQFLPPMLPDGGVQDS